MNRWPDSPSDWEDYNQVLWRDFHFLTTPDIEILKRLVKEHIPDRGNDSYRRARLLGILNSRWDDANSLFWTRHYHPKTYKLRLLWKKLSRKFHRYFKTKKFKKAVRMCEISRDVVNNLIKEGKIND